MAYKFIYFDNAICEMMEVHKDSRNSQEIFQRDGEIHIDSDFLTYLKEEFYEI